MKTQIFDAYLIFLQKKSKRDYDWTLIPCVAALANHL